MRRLTAFFAAIAGSLPICCAQSFSPPQEPDRGLLPMSTYSVSDIENISVMNGNLSLQIPLVKLPPGPAGSSAGLFLSYNSAIYDVNPTYEHWPPDSTNYNFVYQWQ